MNYENCVYVVTGCAGFVGRALCDRLHSLGLTVVGIDKIKIENVSWEFYQLDICQLPDSFLSGRKIKTVFHCAALVPIVSKKQDFYLVNAFATAELFRWASNLTAQYFIYISSSAVYGIENLESPITEETATDPFELYGKSKLEGEKLLKQERLGCSTALAIVRPRTVLGPSRLGIFSLLFEWISTGLPIFILGTGNARYQFVHVDDVIDLLIQLSQMKIEGVFLCGGSDVLPMKKAIRTLCHDVNSTSRLILLPSKIFEPILSLISFLKLIPFTSWHFKAMQMDFYFDLTSTMTRTGWVPRYGTREILTSAYNDFVGNKQVISTAGGESPHSIGLKSPLLRLMNKVIALFSISIGSYIDLISCFDELTDQKESENLVLLNLCRKVLDKIPLNLRILFWSHFFLSHIFTGIVFRKRLSRASHTEKKAILALLLRTPVLKKMTQFSRLLFILCYDCFREETVYSE